MWLKIFERKMLGIFDLKISIHYIQDKNLQNSFSTYYSTDGGLESFSWSWIKIVLSSQVVRSSSKKIFLQHQ